MSLDTIAPWAVRTLTGTRAAQGSYMNGILVPGSTTPLSITAAVWQADEKYRDLFPEGASLSEGKVIRTTTQLFPASDADDSHGGDVITIDGENFEVVGVKTRLDFYECGAVRL